MTTITIKVEGGRELQAKMQKLSLAVATKLGAKAVGAGAQVIRKIAQSRAPVYTEEHEVEKGGQKVTVQPGNLRKNIIVKRIKDTDLAAEYIVTVRNDRKSGFAARYGRLVEYGTVNFSARPFLRPALDQGKNQAIIVMMDRLAKGIAKEVS